jgi:hypothetical protein
MTPSVADIAVSKRVWAAAAVRSGGVAWLLHPAGYDNDCFSAATDLLDL